LNLRQIVLRDRAASKWLVFSQPVEVLVARESGDVASVIESAESRVARNGLYAAGFLSYEASPAFDPAFVTRPAGTLPLAVFGLFQQPQRLDELPSPGLPTGEPPVWEMTIDRDRYRANIAGIRRQIALGNTYQVNYTVRQAAKAVDDPWRLFHAIAADAPYAAYIDAADFAIVSASPELFFELSGERIVCRPMKGTAPRGMTLSEDERIRESLDDSAKNRAENVMITDMVRNDVGRIAVPGSVVASSLFETEKYRTVWQMTSTVSAETHAGVADILCALFPSASITGAPKVASMRLIAQLEDAPRGIYTGCIGYLGPGREGRFSVAIRTAAIDKRSRTAVYGVGGGIVWDSNADDEYQECLDKAGVLASTARTSGFQLLETILWTRQDGFYLLREHLQRLGDSARYFDFNCDVSRVEQELQAVTAKLKGIPYRVRLLLRTDGSSTIETHELHTEGVAKPLRICLARNPVDPRNAFLYHKTTEREVYERALADAGTDAGTGSGTGNCDDVLLWNTRGEITETAIANVVARVDGRLVTPPVECGLLGGTLRQSLLAQGRIAERRILLTELPEIDELFLINSVRGWRPAVIAEKYKAVR
jgi:para-aminobenzoate synthetase/4-amino-4-deoxychorismate lyase